MSSYLVVKNTNSDSCSYLCKDTHTSVPYLKVDTGYLDLTTETTTGTYLVVKNSDSTYRPKKFITSTQDTSYEVTTGYSYRRTLYRYISDPSISETTVYFYGNATDYSNSTGTTVSGSFTATTFINTIGYDKSWSYIYFTSTNYSSTSNSYSNTRYNSWVGRHTITVSGYISYFWDNYYSPYVGSQFGSTITQSRDSNKYYYIHTSYGSQKTDILMDTSQSSISFINMAISSNGQTSFFSGFYNLTLEKNKTCYWYSSLQRYRAEARAPVPYIPYPLTMIQIITQPCVQMNGSKVVGGNIVDIYTTSQTTYSILHFSWSGIYEGTTSSTSPYWETTALTSSSTRESTYSTEN